MRIRGNVFRWLRSLGTIVTGGLNPSADNSINLGAAATRWASGLFGTTIGIHDGTRFRGSIGAGGAYKMIDNTGSEMAGFDSAGNLSATKTGAGGTWGIAVAMINKSTGATVAGKVYIFNGAADNSVGVLMTTVGTYLAAGAAGQLFVCIGGGVADGSVDYFVPFINGLIVPIYCDGAMTRGQYCIRSNVNAGQGMNSATSPAGTTYGMVMAATGGAGLCNVRLGLVYA